MKTLFVIGLVTSSIPLLAQEKIVIFDSGYNIVAQHQWQCNEGKNDLDLTHTSMMDNVSHGELINEIIGKGLDLSKYCIVNIKYINHFGDLVGEIPFLRGLDYVLSLKDVKYLNYSTTGDTWYQEEYKIFKTLTENNIKIVVAAGNENSLLSYDGKCESFPPCYSKYLKKNLYVVGGLVKGEKWQTSNYGPVVKYWENAYHYSTTYNRNLFGTSFAAPLFLKRKLLK